MYIHTQHLFHLEKLYFNNNHLYIKNWISGYRSFQCQFYFYNVKKCLPIKFRQIFLRNWHKKTKVKIKAFLNFFLYCYLQCFNYNDWLNNYFISFVCFLFIFIYVTICNLISFGSFGRNSSVSLFKYFLYKN